MIHRLLALIYTIHNQCYKARQCKVLALRVDAKYQYSHFVCKWQVLFLREVHNFLEHLVEFAYLKTLCFSILDPQFSHLKTLMMRESSFVDWVETVNLLLSGTVSISLFDYLKGVLVTCLWSLFPWRFYWLATCSISFSLILCVKFSYFLFCIILICQVFFTWASDSADWANISCFWP